MCSGRSFWYLYLAITIITNIDTTSEGETSLARTVINPLADPPGPGNGISPHSVGLLNKNWGLIERELSVFILHQGSISS